ncbi:MAG: response regulator transcription factor [Clostridia bacterium]|nr:response regulator transcription factor [Clostridia bacterium]
MNIAIIDDVAEDRLRLEQVLLDYRKIHQLDMIFCHFTSGEAILQNYRPFQYAVIFLDIFMADMSGIETARIIREMDDDVSIVFLTASEIHRSDAFSLFASAYLSKPVSSDRVFRTMDHLLRLKTQDGQRINISYNRQDYSLRCADIVSLEKGGNYMFIADRNGQTYRTRMTFSEAENLVDSRFLVLMKGLMVNMDFIQQIKDNQCMMLDGSVFPLHIKKSRELRQQWLNYKFASIRGKMNVPEHNS